MKEKSNKSKHKTFELKTSKPRWLKPLQQFKQDIKTISEKMGKGRVHEGSLVVFPGDDRNGIVEAAHNAEELQPFLIAELKESSELAPLRETWSSTKRHQRSFLPASITG